MQQRYKIGNEHGSIVWDIKLILKDIQTFHKCKLNVEELYFHNPAPINEDYAMTTDISQPIIVVQLSDDIDKVIDGNHRLYNAHKLGIPTIQCYYLSEEEHTKYICNYHSRTYTAVVDNW